MTSNQTSRTSMESNHDDPESPKVLLHDPPSGTPINATGEPPIDGVEYARWGIYTLAFEKRTVFPSPWSLQSSFVGVRDNREPVHRYLRDCWKLSRWYTLELYLWMVGKTILPSLSLYFGSFVILSVDALVRGQTTEAEIIEDIRSPIVSWMICGALSYWVDISMIRLRGELGGRLRSYFLPRVARAALMQDIRKPSEMDNQDLPWPSQFGPYIPGWDMLVNIFSRLTSILTIIVEMLSMLAIMLCFEDRFDAYMMSSLVASFLFAAFLLPTNGAGGRGYVYWTNSQAYHKVMRLFESIFDHSSRYSLLKDGSRDLAINAFDEVLKEVGVVTTDTYMLDWHVLPKWYWGVTRFLVLHYPMAVGGLFGLLSSSRLTVMTTIIFQYSVFTMNESIRTLEAEGTTGSILDNINGIKKLYDNIDKACPATNGKKEIEAQHITHKCDFPIEDKSPGLKIELQNISHMYPGSESFAIEDINFSIQPGQFIIIAGQNGSGKTTLAKVLSGLLQQTSGKVLVNDINLEEIDPDKFRQEMVFSGSSEVIYRNSLRDNFLYGLTSKAKMDSTTLFDLEKAAIQGGAIGLIKKYGWDKILNPCSITAYSLRHDPGRKAVDALRRFGPETHQTQISPGEHQRIVASRMFTRLNRQKARVIVLDEPANALDAIAEREVFENFRSISRKEGKTMIVVTHRLHLVAKDADLVLCMKNGRIEERGTHEELINIPKGLYGTLYKAGLAIVDSSAKGTSEPTIHEC